MRGRRRPRHNDRIEEKILNKRKKVAWHKHLKAARKAEAKKRNSKP